MSLELKQSTTKAQPRHTSHTTWAARAAALVGAAVITWVAAGHVNGSPLALVTTLLIAAFFALGVLELHRYQQATAALDQSLAALDGTPAEQPPVDLPAWLATLPEPLRNPVRMRIDGLRAALPGPALTPYLTGLLVLLGMLGTFLGMVVTLNGTGLALAQATDVQALRDTLAAPVRGLGLAFGTSVAGVAGSAMLGLMSTLCRRDRTLAAARLDAHIAGVLREHTPAQQRIRQREATLQMQQQQAQLLPQLAQGLQALMTQIDAQARQSHEQQLQGQQTFHAQTTQAWQQLAASVEQSLQHSLTRSLEEGARLAAATLQPAVASTMAGITRETAALHQHVSSAVQQQLDGLSQRHAEHATALADRLGAQAQDQATALLQALDTAQRTQHARQAESDEARMATWSHSLQHTADAVQQAWRQASEQSLAQQAQICGTLEDTAARITAQAEAHARSTIAEITQLVQSATDAPRAAAEVIAGLRGQLSDNLQRDHAMLEQHSRVMAQVNELLTAVQHTNDEQKAAIERLVTGSAAWLDGAGTRWAEQVDTVAQRLSGISAQLTGSAVEVASLGEAFGTAVELFGQSSREMTAQLQRVEAALAQSTTRSDEQLAYYVAQAREVIDLSLLSQKQIVDELQRVATATTTATARQPAAAVA